MLVGGALVVPAGLLLGPRTPPDLLHTRITEQIAMQAVMQAEIALGNHPTDVSAHNLGYDVESLSPADQSPGDGRLRFIEVKGYGSGARAVTVTKNEILTGINSAEQFVLALVEVRDGEGQAPRYVRAPFQKEPDFGVESVNYDLRELLGRSAEPG